MPVIVYFYQSTHIKSVTIIPEGGNMLSRNFIHYNKGPHLENLRNDLQN